MKGIIRILGWDRIQCLPITCIVALGGAEINCAGDIAFMGVAVDEYQKSSMLLDSSGMTNLCTRYGLFAVVSPFSIPARGEQWGSMLKKYMMNLELKKQGSCRAAIDTDSRVMRQGAMPSVALIMGMAKP